MLKLAKVARRRYAQIGVIATFKMDAAFIAIIGMRRRDASPEVRGNMPAA
ncbi:MAG: hypothetical protein LBH85_01795 [Treponema sp.]|nr:hypothetical protein [Treponema sp.]